MQIATLEMAPYKVIVVKVFKETNNNLRWEVFIGSKGFLLKTCILRS